MDFQIGTLQLMNELAIQEVSNSDMIRSRIFTIRGVQVMLDRDLAELYGVATKALNQAVKRNIERFPSEFSFLLFSDEMRELVTNCDRFQTVKHSTVPMRAFTEHGIIMLASSLKSDAATQASIRQALLDRMRPYFFIQLAILRCRPLA